MEDNLKFSPNSKISDALAHGPKVAAVFLRYRMYCVGCTFARFETLRAAAINHRVDVEEFIESLNTVMSKSKEGLQAGDSPTNEFSQEV